MSFPSRGTHVTRIMYSWVGEHSSLTREHLFLVIPAPYLPRTHIIPSVTVVAVFSVVTVPPAVIVIPISANREVSQQVIHSGSQRVSHSVSKSANKSLGQSTTSQLISQTVKCQSAIWSVNGSVNQQVSQSVRHSISPEVNQSVSQ